MTVIVSAGSSSSTLSLPPLSVQVLICTLISQSYCYLMSIDLWWWENAEIPDPIVSEWPLMHDFFATGVIVLTYLFMVWFGPKLMESRQAFSLKYVLIVYNAFISVLSLYMVVECFLLTYVNKNFNTMCQLEDKTYSPEMIRLRRIGYLYFLSKIVELLDTMFFILRKKSNQVTFLHVYHHTNVIVFTWFGIKFVPTGESWFLCLINSSVHVIMYMYYLISALGPQFQKYLWWKRYMTQIQLFCCIIFHYTRAYNLNCGFSRRILLAFILNTMSFLILFLNFYVQAYMEKKSHHLHSKSNGSATISKNGIRPVANGTISNGHVKSS